MEIVSGKNQLGFAISVLGPHNKSWQYKRQYHTMPLSPTSKENRLIRYCMRCLTELSEETRKECFKCKRVTCSSRECGIWAVMNRFWSCQVCVMEEIDALIDQHDNKLEPKEDDSGY